MLFVVKQCETFAIKPDEILTSHFILTQNSAERVKGFSEKKFTAPSGKTYFLRTGDYVDSAKAEAPDGSLLVLFVGLGVDRDGQIVTSASLKKMLRAQPTLESIAHELSYCAGRYNFFVFSKDHERGYCDPNGLLGFVYNLQTGTVASAPTLCFEGDPEPEPDYPANYREAFGYTRDARVRRLCPNHYVDLKSHSETRHWPVDKLDLIDLDDEEGFTNNTLKFIERHQQIVGALSKHASPAILPLTGGQDSRILLATAKNALSDIDLLFTHKHNDASREDALVGEMLANSVGRRLTLYDVLQDDEIGDDEAAIKDLFARNMIASGNTLALDYPANMHGKVARWRLKCALFPPSGGILMRGHVTDISQGLFYYRAAQRIANGRDLPHLVPLRRMMIAPADIQSKNNFDGFVMKRYDEWLSNMPVGMKERIIDIVGIEQYRSYTLTASFQGSYNNFYISPGNDRLCIEMATAIQPLPRRDGKMNAMISDALAPEFSTIPFRKDFKEWAPEQVEALQAAVQNRNGISAV